MSRDVIFCSPGTVMGAEMLEPELRNQGGKHAAPLDEDDNRGVDLLQHLPADDDA